MKNFENLLKVIKQLRDPINGCPWDLEQTHQSLIPYLLEESHEFAHATLENDSKLMEEELGDVLLQVVLHCQIASETKNFDIESVCKVLADKMIRRHPHVFANSGIAISSEQVAKNWQKIKEKENKTEDYYISHKDNIFPALQSAFKIGKKSSKVNFDWDNADEVRDKVIEEINEFLEESKNQNQKKMQEEFGDLLFSMAQLARHLNIDPEVCLKSANAKFIKRFNLVEDKVKTQGRRVVDTPRNELENLWQEVKNEHKK